MSRNNSERHNSDKYKDDHHSSRHNSEKHDNNFVNTDLIPVAFANYQTLISTDKRKFYSDLNEDVNMDEQLDDHRSHKRESDHNNDKKHDSDVEKKDTEEKKWSYYSDSGKNKDDESAWSEEEKKERKMDMLRKLAELAGYGCKITTNYNMDSSYSEMKFEYDFICKTKSKKDSVDWMSGILVYAVKGIELFNDKFNPFDMKFGNAISSNIVKDIKDYKSTIGDIYEKYGSKGEQMDPILKLCLKVAGAGIFIKGMGYLADGGLENFVNHEDELNEDPETIKQLQKKSNNVFEKENDENQQKIEDHHFMEKSKNDYNKMKNAADNTSMADNLNKGLMFSEKSRMSNRNFINMDNIKDDLDRKTKTLTEMTKKLDKQMYSDKSSSKKNTKKSVKDDESSDSPKNKKKMDVDSDSSSRKSRKSASSTISNVSSISNISINPDIRKIIKNSKNKKLNYTANDISDEDISVGTVSRKSDKKNKKK